MQNAWWKLGLYKTEMFCYEVAADVSDDIDQ